MNMPPPAILFVNASLRSARTRETQMMQVGLEVRTGAGSFRVSVRARSIRRAFSLVGDRYLGAEASLVLPVELESLFAGDAFASAELFTLQTPEMAVG